MNHIAFFKFLSGILLIMCFISSCTDPTTIGSELLDGDNLETDFIDTFTLNSYTIEGDSVQTFSFFQASRLPYYFLGITDNNLFGKANSSVYTQFSYTGNGPDFEDTFIDSIVLVLPISNENSFGLSNENLDITVLELDEIVDTSIAIYSDTSYSTKDGHLANYNIQISTDGIDSVTVLVPKNDSLGFNELKLGPQLRIPIEDPALFETLINDESIYEDDDTFTEAFNGIKIVPNNNTKSQLALLINNNDDAGLYVYYHSDTANIFYKYPIANEDLKMTTYELDYSNSIVETAIQNPSTNQDINYLQGLSGVDVRIDLPSFQDFKTGYIINKAELVVTADITQEENDLYTPPLQLVISYLGDDGSFFLVEDALQAILSNLSLEISSDLFGGNFVEVNSDETGTYTMNITAHVQNMLRNSISGQIKLSIYNKQQFANRTVIYGGSHSDYPMQLRLYYTKI